jgi:Icc-related predicted phosphoesterase
MVPPDTDILITHTPPFSILDRHHGSRALMDRLAELNVRLSLFGHIHECHGFTIKGHTTFVNASSIGTIDSGPWLPIIIDLSEDSIEVQAPRHLPLT